MIFHDSQDELYRTPYGAQPTKQNVTLRVKAINTVSTVTVRLWYSDKGELRIPMERSEKGGFLEASFFTNSEPGWLWYYFIIENVNGNIYYYGNNDNSLGGEGRLYRNDPKSYQITVYDADGMPPAWPQESVMYHIFVDRFNRGKGSPTLGTGLKKSNVAHPIWQDEPMYNRDETGSVLQYDFFGGDFRGIIDKIPYLNSMGVNLLYLSPIMDSISNHKYDIGDYKKPDPAFGDERVFRMLTAKAHAYGMKVILDGVFSHNGSDSIYFNAYGHYPSLGASQSKESPYYEWYTFSQYPNQYESWWGMKNMPNVKEDTPSYLHYMIWDDNSVVRYWHRNGIDGWRLDVADELPDTFLEEFRKGVKEVNPEAFIIGEVWEDASHKESYGKLRPYFQGHSLDSVMNYPFRSTVIDVLCGRKTAEEGMAKLNSLHENYPPQIFNSVMNLLSSHDETRVMTMLGEAPSMDGWSQGQRQAYRLPIEQYERGRTRLLLGLLWQFTFPGIPDIYYGDEAGLEGDKDPYNRRPFPWGKEDSLLQDSCAFFGTLWKEHAVLRKGEYKAKKDSTLVRYCRRLLNTDKRGKTGYSIGEVIINPTQQPIHASLSLDISLQWKKIIVTATGIVEEKLDSVERSGITIPGETGILYIGVSDGIDSKTGEYVEEPLIPFSGGCGVLLHPTSLPAIDGIGDMGKTAYEWIDLLAETGQTYWQVLPLTMPADGNSPYTAFSGIAGDIRLISLDQLVDVGLLTKDMLAKGRKRETKKDDLRKYILGERKEKSSLPQGSKSIDTQLVRNVKLPLLKEAWKRFKAEKGKTLATLWKQYMAFTQDESSWLDDYSLFQAMKLEKPTKSWMEWGPLSRRDKKAMEKWREELGDTIGYVSFVQWLFHVQWEKLHTYAHDKGIRIIGDLPFFVAQDSADVWANPHLFDVNASGLANTVAGVPPDYFSQDGQRWGNAQYDWDAMKEDEYEWWITNLKHLLRLVDVVRLDHFRGYESFWEIPSSAPTAATGKWVKGPGVDLFRAVHKVLGEAPLIAEDLGIITNEVETLRKESNFPGMRVLEFSFSQDPVELSGLSNRIVYTGTHDNNTLIGWIHELKEKDYFTLQQVSDFVGLSVDASPIELGEAILREAYTLPSYMTIVPIQDLLFLDEKHRMNMPGVVNESNWVWALDDTYSKGDLRDRMKVLANLHKNRS